MIIMDEDHYLALGMILIVFGMMFICGLNNRLINTVQNTMNTQNTSNINENVYEAIL